MAVRYECPRTRLKRWRRKIDRGSGLSLTRTLLPNLFKRNAPLRLQVRSGEMRMLEHISREWGLPVATCAWGILSEYLASIDCPELAPGLSVAPHGIADAEGLHENIRGSMPDGRWGPQATSAARRSRHKRFDEAVRLKRELEKILGPQQIRFTRFAVGFEEWDPPVED